MGQPRKISCLELCIYFFVIRNAQFVQSVWNVLLVPKCGCFCSGAVGLLQNSCWLNVFFVFVLMIVNVFEVIVAMFFLRMRRFMPDRVTCSLGQIVLFSAVEGSPFSHFTTYSV